MKFCAKFEYVVVRISYALCGVQELPVVLGKSGFREWGKGARLDASRDTRVCAYTEGGQTGGIFWEDFIRTCFEYASARNVRITTTW